MSKVNEVNKVNKMNRVNQVNKMHRIVKFLIIFLCAITHSATVFSAAFSSTDMTTEISSLIQKNYPKTLDQLNRLSQKGEGDFITACLSGAANATLNGVYTSCNGVHSGTFSTSYDQGNAHFTSGETDNIQPGLTVVGVLNDMQNNVADNGNDVLFAQGQALSCREPINMPGMQNCCDDAMTRHSVSFNACSNDEKTLAGARQAKRSVYLGQYCSHFIHFLLGQVCVERKEVYCVFSTLLDRLMQEQGRAQIHSPSWGDAQNPHCNGFSSAEMQAIDWNQLDLTEYENSLGVPNSENVSQLNSSEYETTANALPAQTNAFNEGTPIVVDAPNATRGDPMSISPLEGYGPFSVTVLLASNWPQYFQDITQNTDPVNRITIDWGDGTQTLVDSRYLILINNTPVYHITHDYAEPFSAQNELENIQAIFYADSGAHAVSAHVQNSENVPSNVLLESAGGHSDTQKIRLNTMPGYGTYSVDQVPGLPDPSP